jgi:hypothetical protein
VEWLSAENVVAVATAVVGIVASARCRYAGARPSCAEAFLTLHDDRGTEVLPTVQKLLGRPARTFTQWARAHAGAFGPSGV